MTNYLISYPRSGNSWFRYCIESVLGIKTTDVNPDHKNKSLHLTIGNRKDLSTEKEIFKAHKFLAENDDKVIFLLRDMQEAVTSHKQRGARGRLDSMILTYLELLDAYDKYSGPKILVRYEDFITKGKIPCIMKKIADFLGEECDTVDFMKRYEEHKNKSQQGYQKHIGGTRNKNVSVNYKVSKSSQKKYKHLLDNYLNTTSELMEEVKPKKIEVREVLAGHGLEALAEKYGTDKFTHGYIPSYEKYFDPIRSAENKILEIGVLLKKSGPKDSAASIQMWRDFFINSEIKGADIRYFGQLLKEDWFDSTRIDFCVTNQERRKNSKEEKMVPDPENKQYPFYYGYGMENIINRFGSNFDVIIDDGGHTMKQNQLCLGYMFLHVKPGGLYVIEDLHTSKIAGSKYNKERTKFTTLEFLKRIKRKDCKGDFISSEEYEYLHGHVQKIEFFVDDKICFIRKKS